MCSACVCVDCLLNEVINKNLNDSIEMHVFACRAVAKVRYLLVTPLVVASVGSKMDCQRWTRNGLLSLVFDVIVKMGLTTAVVVCVVTGTLKDIFLIISEQVKWQMSLMIDYEQLL